MRIVFMGTPDFAVASLDALLQAGYEVVGVITATDKWGGRGNKELIQSDVKKYAESKGLRVLQPEKLRNEDFLAELRSLQADLQVVVAFRMLPEVVWAMPRLGTFNLHASLLPKYRGAAPINWAVINGERETGVSTFFLQREIDTGDLLFQEKTEIQPEETFGELYNRLKIMGADLVVKTVQAIENNSCHPIPQDHSLACPAPKLFADNTRIRFDQPAEAVRNFIRGLAPFPTAWFTLDGQQVKVYRAEAESYPNHPFGIGQFIYSAKPNVLKIACLDGFIHLEELQIQGKKRLAKRDFLNGFRTQSAFADGYGQTSD